MSRPTDDEFKFSLIAIDEKDLSPRIVAGREGSDLALRELSPEDVCEIPLAPLRRTFARDDAPTRRDVPLRIVDNDNRLVGDGRHRARLRDQAATIILRFALLRLKRQRLRR